MDAAKGCYLQRSDKEGVRRVWAVLDNASLSLYTKEKKGEGSSDLICTVDVSNGSVCKNSARPNTFQVLNCTEKANPDYYTARKKQTQTEDHSHSEEDIESAFAPQQWDKIDFVCANASTLADWVRRLGLNIELKSEQEEENKIQDLITNSQSLELGPMKTMKIAANDYKTNLNNVNGEHVAESTVQEQVYKPSPYAHRPRQASPERITSPKAKTPFEIYENEKMKSNSGNSGVEDKVKVVKLESESEPDTARISVPSSSSPSSSSNAMDQAMKMIKVRRRFTMQLTQIYTLYNPEKIDNIPEIIDNFQGREQALLEQLKIKYKIEDAHHALLFGEYEEGEREGEVIGEDGVEAVDVPPPPMFPPLSPEGSLVASARLDAQGRLELQDEDRMLIAKASKSLEALNDLPSPITILRNQNTHAHTHTIHFGVDDDEMPPSPPDSPRIPISTTSAVSKGGSNLFLDPVSSYDVGGSGSSGSNYSNNSNTSSPNSAVARRRKNGDTSKNNKNRNRNRDPSSLSAAPVYRKLHGQSEPPLAKGKDNDKDNGSKDKPISLSPKKGVRGLFSLTGDKLAEAEVAHAVSPPNNNNYNNAPISGEKGQIRAQHKTGGLSLKTPPVRVGKKMDGYRNRGQLLVDSGSSASAWSNGNGNSNRNGSGNGTSDSGIINKKRGEESNTFIYDESSTEKHKNTNNTKIGTGPSISGRSGGSPGIRNPKLNLESKKAEHNQGWIGAQMGNSQHSSRTLGNKGADGIENGYSIVNGNGNVNGSNRAKSLPPGRSGGSSSRGAQGEEKYTNSQSNPKHGKQTQGRRGHSQDSQIQGARSSSNKTAPTTGTGTGTRSNANLGSRRMSWVPTNYGTNSFNKKLGFTHAAREKEESRLPGASDGISSDGPFEIDPGYFEYGGESSNGNGNFTGNGGDGSRAIQFSPFDNLARHNQRGLLSPGSSSSRLTSPTTPGSSLLHNNGNSNSNISSNNSSANRDKRRARSSSPTYIDYAYSSNDGYRRQRSPSPIKGPVDDGYIGPHKSQGFGQDVRGGSFENRSPSPPRAQNTVYGEHRGLYYSIEDGAHNDHNNNNNNSNNEFMDANDGYDGYDGYDEEEHKKALVSLLNGPSALHTHPNPDPNPKHSGEKKGKKSSSLSLDMKDSKSKRSTNSTSASTSTSKRALTGTGGDDNQDKQDYYIDNNNNVIMLSSTAPQSTTTGFAGNSNGGNSNSNSTSVEYTATRERTWSAKARDLNFQDMADEEIDMRFREYLVHGSPRRLDYEKKQGEKEKEKEIGSLETDCDSGLGDFPLPLPNTNPSLAITYPSIQGGPGSGPGPLHDSTDREGGRGQSRGREREKNVYMYDSNGRRVNVNVRSGGAASANRYPTSGSHGHSDTLNSSTALGTGVGVGGIRGASVDSIHTTHTTDVARRGRVARLGGGDTLFVRELSPDGAIGASDAPLSMSEEMEDEYRKKLLEWSVHQAAQKAHKYDRAHASPQSSRPFTSRSSTANTANSNGNKPHVESNESHNNSPYNSNNPPSRVGTNNTQSPYNRNPSTPKSEFATQTTPPSGSPIGSIGSPQSSQSQQSRSMGRDFDQEFNHHQDREDRAALHGEKGENMNNQRNTNNTNKTTNKSTRLFGRGSALKGIRNIVFGRPKRSQSAFPAHRTRNTITMATSLHNDLQEAIYTLVELNDPARLNGVPQLLKENEGLEVRLLVNGI